MPFPKKLLCRLAGNRSARGSGVTSKSPGTRKISFFKTQSKHGENFQFSGGFQERQSTSSYRPSFLRHVPALVEEEFKDPEFCKRVAGLERMLRIKSSH